MGYQAPPPEFPIPLSLNWSLRNCLSNRLPGDVAAADPGNIPWEPLLYSMGFPGGSDGKESAFNTGDLGSTPGLGRFPGEENGNPLQNSCLENPMDRGAWQAPVHGVTKSQTWLSEPYSIGRWPLAHVILYVMPKQLLRSHCEYSSSLIWQAEWGWQWWSRGWYR